MFDCEGDSSGLLTLHYGKHNISLIEEIRQWFLCDTFADMTIICEKGQLVRGHRLVLAAASPLVKRLLEESDISSENAVVIQMPDVKESHMKTVLTFLYTGQVNVEVNIQIYVIIFFIVTFNFNLRKSLICSKPLIRKTFFVTVVIWLLDMVSCTRLFMLRLIL